MAHQTGVANVVATMGTALTARHVQQLRRFAGPGAGVVDLEVRASGGAAVADPVERELVEVLLAEPELVEKAKAELEPEEVEHPGIRRMLVSLYELLDEGLTPDLDALRVRILDNP